MVTADAATTELAIYSVFQDEPDFQELLEEFVTAANERRGLLQTLYRQGEVAGIKVQAHQLKGAGGGYGFEGLSELSARLEDACKEAVPNLDEIGPLLDAVVEYLGRVRA
jgi:HPt (histidine-containing phosphotransfer) domain-containing protein